MQRIKNTLSEGWNAYRQDLAANLSWSTVLTFALALAAGFGAGGLLL